MSDKRKKNKNLILFLEFLICSFIILSVFNLRTLYGKTFYKENSDIQEVKDTNKKETTNQTTDNKEKVKLTSSQKDEELNKIINSYARENNKISVIYKDMKSGYRYSVNDDEYFSAASTTKVVYALYIYDRIENGQLKSDEEIEYRADMLESGGGEITNREKQKTYPIDYVVMNMLKYSDNTATNMLLINKTNGIKLMMNYMSKLGFELPADKAALNKVTPLMMEKVWTYLYENQNKYPKIIEYLKESENNEWIKSGISNKKIASKYGQLAGVANNTAIVYGDNNEDYILIIYTENLSNSEKVIPELANKINKLHDENI
ncbi:serine hydrolase [Gemella sp. GH3]|uniref:serine hydrolase n=1 Tax=unclassified Gemella TaxID=2624949 RepID=UPI0015CFC46C|nr:MULTISPECIES: serine hydrolase [unclassified Gemella]MBF0713928.1 serine hydrolase [Gemella sp. GH3.1]NYS50880.1 serine hydrolase [Gemella sp. GH3]